MLKYFILTSIFSSTLSYSIPSYVHLCKRNDPELVKCFVNTMHEIRPYLKKGIPEMNLSPIEPFKIESLKFFSGTNPNNALEIDVFDGTLENLSNYNVTKFVIDFDKGYYDSELHFTNIKLNSKYRLKGKLLVFNLDTEGDFKFEIGEGITNAEWFAKRYIKKDKEYFNFFASNVTTKINGFSIHFENVFNDKALNDNFNSVVNKNLDVLLPELSPILNEAINIMALKYLNSVYSVFPLDVLYPND